ncbi:MAG: dihydroneopterin aldolase family protein [Candidatus Helarchaeota archaeon]
MEKIEAIAKKYFGKDITDRDRAIFEGAITLGAIFHQFNGIPVTQTTAPVLKEAIEKTMALQPFIEKVSVKIDEQTLRTHTHTYDYTVLSGDKYELEVISQYGDVRVQLGMKFLEELDYPLMFIKRIGKAPKKGKSTS